MSHESVIAGLKRLIKSDLMGIDPGKHVDHMYGESDRSFIILEAATLEALILDSLKKRMPSLNGEERERIFNFEGPCGSFSNRIRLAQGLGLMDRPTRRRVELVKEMRNAAAHCHLPITFDTPEIRDAVCALFPAEFAPQLRKMTGQQVRLSFSLVCGEFGSIVTEDDYEPEFAGVVSQVLE